MEKIGGYPCSLALPVKPYTPYTVMKMIVPYDHINSSMKLDAAYFGTGEITLIVYMMYMVVLDKRKYTSEIAHDTGLATVMDIAVPYDMRTNTFLAPAVKLSYKGAVTLCLVCYPSRGQ